jgi:2-haloacid dehalogenase
MNTTLAFHVYGTLVDPFGMAKHLAHDLGAKAANFANCWREKQLEYSFRRALMRNYADFSVCTSDALNFTYKRFKAAISAGRQSELLRLSPLTVSLDLREGESAEILVKKTRT